MSWICTNCETVNTTTKCDVCNKNFGSTPLPSTEKDEKLKPTPPKKVVPPIIPKSDKDYEGVIVWGFILFVIAVYLAFR